MNPVRRNLLCVLLLCSFSSLAFSQDMPDSGQSASTPYGSASTPVGPQSPGASSPYSAGYSGGGGQKEMSAEAPVVAPAAISVPGGYGFIPQSFVPGEGRFAQPPYRITFSLAQGYDDNVFTAPNHGGRLPFPGARLNTLPKVGSWENYAGLGVQIRLASPRSVFTADANFGGTYYWHRSDTSFDYYDNVSLAYAHQFNPRLQGDAQLNIAVAPQPDFSNFNAPSSSQNSSGEYFLGSVKFDLSYQWTPKFSTITSYAFNTLLYTDGAFGSGDYYQNLIGNQFRLLLSPRFTAVAEYRFGYVLTNSTTNDSASHYLLGGFDYMLSRRLSFTLRAGSELRTYAAGPYETSPYVETTLQYLYGHGSTIVWQNRYGFEPSGLNQTRQTAYRTGLIVNQVITPRITANLNFNYDHFDTEFVNGLNSQHEDDFNVNVGATYAMNKNFSLNAFYAFTDVLSSLQFTGYTRNRVFFGVTYGF